MIEDGVSDQVAHIVEDFKADGWPSFVKDLLSVAESILPGPIREIQGTEPRDDENTPHSMVLMSARYGSFGKQRATANQKARYES